MNRNEIILILGTVLFCLPLVIMGFISEWRDKQADKEEARQNQALA